MQGQDECRAYLEDFPTPITFTADIKDIEGEGGLAYTRGDAKATYDDGSQATFTWMAIFRRQPGGSWKVARDIFVAP